MTPAQNMKVQMINGLRPIGTVVDDQAKSVVQIQLLRHLLAHRHQVTQKGAIIVIRYEWGMG